MGIIIYVWRAFIWSWNNIVLLQTSDVKASFDNQASSYDGNFKGISTLHDKNKSSYKLEVVLPWYSFTDTLFRTRPIYIMTVMFQIFVEIKNISYLNFNTMLSLHHYTDEENIVDGY